MNAQPDFNSIRQLNPYGQEYWYARDLMPLLGYTKWERFSGAIKRAMIACENTGNLVSLHFPGAGKTSPMPHGGVREVEDYALSRFACYLIAQNGDPRKPEIAAAQVYFAISTRANEIHQLLKEQNERLETRLKVSESFRQLAEAAQGAGVMSENFGIFMDAGYMGLHRHTREELMTIKDIPSEEEYLDNIGRPELSAIDFKNVQTEEKLRREGVAGEDRAIDTHYFVGNEVRKALEAINAPMPETLPRAPSIRKLVEERRMSAKKRRVNTDKQKWQPLLLDTDGDENKGQ
ncbi:MAG: DNA damage-inducible protein D [Ktedonobacteraceae bacterium]